MSNGGAKIVRLVYLPAPQFALQPMRTRVTWPSPPVRTTTLRPCFVLPVHVAPAADAGSIAAATSSAATATTTRMNYESSFERSADKASTACAACSPWSRLPPPVRASAWSMFSTVSTPKAHGTPVRSWTSWIPRAASEQT